ncbi:phage virion morphogenesis protein [Acinetobacter sp.]|uniref:phage virion morphogenesis protein n=1 Tax=Acinetobacter sp. TaxID=472 RepID=UPI002FDB3498
MKTYFDLSDEAEKKLNKIMQFVEGSQRQLLNIIGSVLTQEINVCFVSARDPWGTAWKPLKVRKGQPLRDKGHLKGSINYQVFSDYVEIGSGVGAGTNLKYAPYHQFGFSRNVAAHSKDIYFKLNRDGTVGHRFVKKSKSDFAQSVNVKAHTIVVSARPFLPINQEKQVVMPQSWNQAIIHNIRNFIEGGL